MPDNPIANGGRRKQLDLSHVPRSYRNALGALAMLESGNCSVVDVRWLKWCRSTLNNVQHDALSGGSNIAVRVGMVKAIVGRMIQGPDYDPEGQISGRLEIDPETDHCTYIPAQQGREDLT